MKTVIALLAMVCFAALTYTSPVLAQDLEVGTWTGTVTPPSSQVFDVTYIVEHTDDALTITMNSPMGPLPFSNIEVGENNITFSWQAGPTHLDCDLKTQEDGSYKGECVDADGSPGTLIMIPPEDEDQQ